MEIIIKHDFKVNYRKTKYKGNQTVTGIDVFLNKIDAPEHIKEKSRLEIENDAAHKPYSIYLDSIHKENKRAAVNR